MAEARRSLGEAMSLTPDKLAFIHGGLPTQDSTGAAESDRESGQSESQEISSQSEIPDTQPAKPPASRPRARPKSEPKTAMFPAYAQEEAGLMPPILVPLNTRLQPQTADTLRRACLEQRLQRKRPFTQQQIVELAVQAWLRTNGFLEPRNDE